MTSIGEDAFLYCSSVSTLYCYATTPPAVFSNSFVGMDYNNTIIYVPKGTKGSYASNEGWNKFVNIVEM